MLKMAKIPDGRPHPGTVQNFDLSKLLFIEVATTSAEKTYSDLEKKNPTIARIFEDSRFSLAERFPEIRYVDNTPIEFFYDKCAGIYPEFGKIVCVSLGALDKEGNIKITTFKGEEKDILLKVRTVLDTAASKYTLCGHNIKSFDIPYLGKRFMINGLKPPTMLPTYETKPWEIKAIDTREIWTFGGFKSFSSLSLISNLLNLPQHTEIKGEDVSTLYWEGEMDKVVEYCESEIKLTIDIINKINSNE